MSRSGGVPLWAILGLQRVWKSKFEKIAIFVWPSLMFSNEIELPAAISRVPQLFGRSRLGFWMPLGTPFKNTSKLENCQKSREIAFFWSAVLRFFLKIETSGGHNSSTPWSWRLLSGFLDAPWIPLHKSIFSEKLTRDTHTFYQNRPKIP